MKKLVGILTIVILIVVAIVLFKFFGFGFGGNGSSNGGERTIIPTDNNSENSIITEMIIETTTAVVTSVSVSETQPVAEYISVTVSGNEYIYNNNKIQAEDLIKELIKYDIKIIVKITDDNSSLKSYNTLKELLEENNISFIEGD